MQGCCAATYQPETLHSPQGATISRAAIGYAINARRIIERGRYGRRHLLL